MFYHLGELNDALHYALRAGDRFDVNEGSDYAQTLIATAIDEYVAKRQSLDMDMTLGDASKDGIDSKLVDVVERMFESCLSDGEHFQAIGIALESKRLDKLEEAITRSNTVAECLSYSMKVCASLVSVREFRQHVLRLLARMYSSLREPNFLSMCQCLMLLEDAHGIAEVLNKLVAGDEAEQLLAYQIAFALFENDIQPFLNRVHDAVGDAEGAAIVSGEHKNGVSAAETDESPLEKLRSILSGERPFALYLEFLYSHNHADLLLLKQVKTAVESRNSVCHSATVLANALTHAGTTCDKFLRENLDWLSRATNWARFSATAGVGVIHRGRTKDSRQLLSQLLPAPSPYTLGGALYAMGLIHTGQPGDALPFLLERARGNNNEVIQHGACLGLGLAAVGTGNAQVDGELFRILRTDSAVAGEAAGIGLGLLYAGSCTPRAKEIHQYCGKTSHGKIVRGCSLGMALTVYGREEGGDDLIESMIHDGDKIMRYGGCLALASAYAGTGNNNALRKLLHTAVSDVSDDVRRSAVMSLGFVLCSTPEQCPRVVALLAESYNPHVRYGAAMAVGIACAGTGLADAIALLDPMMNDQVDFVQQGALIAMAMVRIQQTEKQLAPFRKKVMGHIQETHETTMCKMGAIMALGILDAGGRNVTIGLRSRSGRPRMTSVLGMLVFTQYWYWYPLSYFLSLVFVPTAFIAVDRTLAMPHCSVTSHCKPSTFAYAAPVTEDDKKNSGEIVKAVLSTTAKAKAKADKKKAEAEGAEGMDVDGAAAVKTDEKTSKTTTEDAMDMEMTKDDAGEAKKEDEEGEKKDDKPEPTSEELTNPSRVTPAQEKAVRFDQSSRFVPIAAPAGTFKYPTRGFVVLRDTDPDEEIAYLDAQFKPVAPPVPADAADDDEPPPPEDFELDPEDEARGF